MTSAPSRPVRARRGTTAARSGLVDLAVPYDDLGWTIADPAEETLGHAPGTNRHVKVLLGTEDEPMARS
jgi:hypothetical protein